MVEGEDLSERVRAKLGDANIPLEIDAVAGKATLNLGGILNEEGTVVNYGLLSGEPCQLTADMLVFKGITLTGFWLAKTLGGMTAEAKQQLYGELESLVASGKFQRRLKQPIIWASWKSLFVMPTVAVAVVRFS